MDEPASIVVFRIWDKIPRTCIALFPYIEADHRGNCTNYEHEGQHGGADYTGVISQTRPAKDHESKDLTEELTRIGYKLDIRQRKPKDKKNGN